MSFDTSDEYDEYLDAVPGPYDPVYYHPDEWDKNGNYCGVQRVLPWWFPKSKADYAIYNTFYPEAPLQFEGQVVENLWKDTHQPSLANDPDFKEYDMDLLYSVAETNYPLEFLGKRDLQYYKDWHDYGTVDPVMNDDASMTCEDVPMEEDADGFVHIKPDKHPKGFPGCN